MTNALQTESTINYSRVDAEDCRIAVANAQLDPDGQVYPWRAGYPQAGATVYTEGQLWTVVAREPVAREWQAVPLKDRGLESPIAGLRLVGPDDSVLIATAEYCRPVTWTQADEAALLASN